ncbi:BIFUNCTIONAL: UROPORPHYRIN-III C-METHYLTRANSFERASE AND UROPORPHYRINOGEN-III SYNTHASE TRANSMEMBRANE PROTEIN [Cupriavidus taiwanensis]|uniref:fused uroporphyrinogen-III synthase HemD/membrane protein HemX n=1 Tax=Cupriavidus taiwanensis TaxID=164546 RepID=UPI000E13938D|nr:fused uroporphyrinogen-III synthase HemD/membrane protein HemX [Cupriavidus taiwanensis]SOZ57214.1 BIFUNCTIONAL: UROPORPHYRIN-III C-METHYLTRANSFERASE AND UROPORPHYRINOGEN-III SYNTHASE TRANSMEMBRANE PROTEIN [Cupriavidus taiwanensis]SOZ79244.1 BIFUNCTIONAL: UROPORPHYRIN-III C-METHYLTRANSFERASE AND UROPORPHYRINOGEN-III SYNTHASE TRANSMEMBRANE PROTEIN [Cupriavidus taiwanensis]SOZ79837.1 BIFUNCTIONAL: UROPORPHYRIN-III C-METHYLTRANSFERASE AND UROPORPHYRINOGEN-III SYNTHASE TRANSMEMBRANE PROTEIN [Cupr
MPRPTVVVTRPAGQSRQLTEALQGAGLDVLSFPLLAIGPAADDAPLRAALARLDTFALVVFVSPNAIAFALDTLAGVQGAAVARWPAQVAVAVVGPASVAALAERGIAAPAYRVIAPAGANANGPGHDDTVPDAEALRFDSEALWAQLDPAALAGKPVLIIRGNGGRDWLGDRLREAGAQVEAVEAYQRTLPEPGAMQWQAVRDNLRPGAAPHAWLLTSSEAVRNLDVMARQHLSPQEDASLRQVQCIAPHARIAEQALALGFAHIQRAAPGDAGLLAACLQWADAYAGPAPSSLPAPPAAAVSRPVEGVAQSAAHPAAHPAASAPAAVPAMSTKVERVTQETTSSSATPPPAAASVHPAQSAQAVPPQGAGHAGAARPAARRSAALWALVAVLVVATAGGFWWLQQRVDHLTGELARRQQSNDALVQESRVLTRNAQDTVKELQAKVGALENQVGETRDKQVALEQVYQDLMRNRDDWEIAEIQQLLTSAGQQLQLTGNVQVALAALQSADARLARTDKPQYNLLRRAIARDVARMKAVPDTDLTGAAIKLDEAINQVDALPLLSSERMLERSEADARKGAAANGGNGASAPAAANGTGPGWFTRFWDYLREELAQVIRIRKVDDAEALLLSGDQGWFLRENVKLRLLNARLALLSRNEPVFRNDLAAAQAMIGRYFDTKSRRVQGVLTLLRQAQAGAVTVQLPTMAESLGALQALKKE